MLFLILRIVIGPLGVLGGTLAQRRLGHTVGGLIIGLPLTSLPLLWLVALQRGGAFTGSMTDALLIGSIVEGLVLWSYAKLTTRMSPTTSLMGALFVFIVAVSAVGMFHLSPLLAGLLTTAGFALALRWWPVTPEAQREQSGRSRLLLRVIAATIFTVILLTVAGALGPVLSGLVDALPMTTMLMAFMTHQEQGADAASRFMHGVARGSFSYVAAMLVLALALKTGDVALAFGLSVAAALVVQMGVQAFDSLPTIKRVFSLL